MFNLGQWLRDIGLTWFGLNINIHTYALCILGGIIIATSVTGVPSHAARRRARVVVDVALWAVTLGIIGARIFHVLTHPDDYFGPGKDLLRDPVHLGGRHRHLRRPHRRRDRRVHRMPAGRRAVLELRGCPGPSLLLAQAFGRLGNYFNHELFGLPTNLPWGLEIESTNPAFPAGLPAARCSTRPSCTRSSGT